MAILPGGVWHFAEQWRYKVPRSDCEGGPDHDQVGQRNDAGNRLANHTENLPCVKEPNPDSRL
jgi:hypothetical protein